MTASIISLDEQMFHNNYKDDLIKAQYAPHTIKTRNSACVVLIYR